MDQNEENLNHRKDENGEDVKIKRKRRSKNEVEGRSFICECGKSYLSQPALTNHKKTKHDADKNTEKRGRGRPKKNVINNSDMIQKAELKFKTFYDKDTRRRQPEPLQIKLNHIDEVFNTLIFPFQKKFSNTYNTTAEHPLLRQVSFSVLHGVQTNGENNPKNCDEIFCDYLKDVSGRTNEKYFLFVFKFVILFRECINKFKNSHELNGREYAEVRGAESAPDLCNEFIIEFMEANDYFGLNSEDDKNEFIEIIQHFCLWLYENGHTSSRLTLLI